MRVRFKDLLPLPPHKAIPPPKTKTPIHLMSRKASDREIRAGAKVCVLFTEEVLTANNQTNPSLSKLLEEFKDVFLFRVTNRTTPYQRY